MQRAIWLLVPLAALLANGCVTFGGATQSAVLRAKDRVAPALVHIRPVKEVYARGKREEFLAIGSGFIISPDGYVVTNEHVAGEASSVRCVLYNQEEVEAKVVGVDPDTDIAVLKLDVGQPLPWVKLGRSSTLQAGQTVLALGSPHGLARSVSMGIVSVTDRYLEARGEADIPYNNWIQTDAAINPGNSGGPLVNLKGEVVGVNARMLSGAENVGFAIPIDVAREVVDQIIAKGRVVRSWLGLSFQEMTRRTQDPAARGVIIADVDPLGPAVGAGVQPGDVLLSINGAPTNARFEEQLPVVARLIANLPVKAQAVLRVLRGEEEKELTVTTEEKAAAKSAEAEFPEWGFTASDLTQAEAREAQLPDCKGVVISGSQVGGIARNARLQKGDIILKMDDDVVENVTQFRQLYEDRLKKNQRLVMLYVKRGAMTRFALIKQDKSAEPAPAEPAPAEPGAAEGGGHEG